MAKDFDATLSEAIDLAAGAAQGPGATAARIRGGKRTRRRRVALSATSFVLVAAISTAAFALSSPHRDAAPQPPAATTGAPPTTPTSSASSSGATPSTGAESSTSTANPPLSVPPSPTGTSPATTPSTNPSSAPTTPSGTSSSSLVVPTVTRLSPDRVPFYSLAHWSDYAPLDCTGSFVFSVDATDYCSSYNSVGNAHAAQKVSVVMYGSSGLAVGFAYQDFFTYANAADAQAAFQSLTQGLLADGPLYNGAIDPNTNRPMVSTTTVTAQRSGSMAIYHKLRDTNGAPGNTGGLNGGASDRHFYCTVKGNVMAIVVTMGDPSMSSTSNDKANLAAVAGTLN